MARPLTKLTKTGTLYTRPAPVEANIDEASAQDLPTLSRRAQVTEPDSSDYLRSECLVHLIRDSIRRGDSAMQSTLLPILLGRCEANLRAKVPRSVANADHLHDEVLSEFALILAKGGSTEDEGELDYYECKFNHAFRTLRISVLRREQSNTDGVVPLLGNAGEPDDELARRVVEALQSPATQADGLMLDELLDALPPEERKAVVLRFVMGHDIESTDKKQPTVAKICGVSGRTIGKRLERARERFSQLKREDL